jgi:hypothetical protein
MISKTCKYVGTAQTLHSQRLVLPIVLLFFVVFLHAGCTAQTTDPAATLLPTPTTPAAAPLPSATAPTLTRTITRTAVLLPTASPDGDDEAAGARLSLHDIPRYPSVQPIPPDKNPVLATIIEEVRQQAGDESQIEAEAFTLVGGEATTPVRDIELFYTTELAEGWQAVPEPRYDVAMPPDRAGGAIATSMSWNRDNQTFMVVVVEMYGQSFLITLLQSDA